MNKKQLDKAIENYRLTKRGKLAKFQGRQSIMNSSERIGILDIETSDLVADIGFMLSYCIQDSNGKIVGRALRTTEFRGKTMVLDRELIRECIADMKKFDRLVCHYGCWFDIPFIRTRAYKYGFQDLFPGPREMCLTDTWIIAKKKFKLHSNRLDSLAKLFKIPAKKHPLDGAEWIAAKTGQQWGLNYVWVHNKEDVETTRLVYEKLQGAMPLTESSI